MNVKPLVNVVHRNFKMPLELAKAIEKYRTDHGISRDSEAIRQLIAAGLSAIETNRKDHEHDDSRAGRASSQRGVHGASGNARCD